MGLVGWAFVGLFFSVVAHGLSVGDIEGALQAPESPFESVEDFLGWIDDRDPGQLDHFTFMRVSRSLQGASPKFPRALTFGEDASFIATFNGVSAHQGYHASEIRQFRQPKAPRFDGAHTELRELTLAPGSTPHLSEANPGKCLRCHYIPARAIWDPYEHWEGAYGTRDDGILDIPNIKFLNISPSPQVRREYDEEFAQYKTFQSIRRQHPRYSRLHFPEGSPVSPYSPMHRGDYKFRANLKLTHALAKQHVMQIVAMLREDQGCYAEYKKVLTASLIGCATTGEKRFEKRMDAVEGRITTKLARKFPRYEPVRWYYSYREPLLERLLPLMGVEHTDWSLRKDPDYWDFYEGAAYLKELVGDVMYPQLASEDSSLPKWSDILDYNAPPTTDQERSDRAENEKEWWDKNPLVKACESLIDSFDPSAESCLGKPKPAMTTAVVSMCASCHDGSEKGIPKIAFDDARWSARIRSRLHETDPDRRMPPTRPLSQKEQAALEAYLR